MLDRPMKMDPEDDKHTTAMKILWNTIVTRVKLEEVTNARLAEMMMEVSYDLDIDSPIAALLAVAAERLDPNVWTAEEGQETS